jgi:hypothetical protein
MVPGTIDRLAHILMVHHCHHYRRSHQLLLAEDTHIIRLVLRRHKCAAYIVKFVENLVVLFINNTFIVCNLKTLYVF